MPHYEYRILQKRARWTMNHVYDEWFRPIGWDYDDWAAVSDMLDALRRNNPDQEYKVQMRPKIRDWDDIG